MVLSKPSTTFSTAAGGFATGLTGTIGYRIVNLTTLATTVARTTAGISETPASSGNYVVSSTAPSAEGRYAIVWDNGTVSPSTVVAEDLLVDVAVTDNGVPLFATPGAHVTYTGPVATNGDITIVRGDDYSNTDGRGLEWTTTSASEWPTLTGATVTFTVKSRSAGTTELTVTGTVVTATGAAKSVRVELTAGQTALAVGNDHAFDVQATLAGGRKVTLVRGTLAVLQDYAA